MAYDARPDSDSDPDCNLGRVQSLVRAFGVLDELSKHDDGLTLTQLAALVALPRSTAHRLLTTMESLRYVEFEQATNLWRVGIQAFTVGSAFAQTRDLARLGRPIMHSLMMDARETVKLAIPDAQGLHYVTQVEATDPRALITRPGQHWEMHTTAAGKAMLAYWSEGRLDQFFRGAGALVSRTAASITESDRLLDNLKLARGSGFAIDDEETMNGMRCIAAPVLGRDGLARASLSISGPISRMPLERLSQLGAMLAAAASRLAGDIGGLQLPVG
jgi:IclR family acetate operon transcriptional repressor